MNCIKYRYFLRILILTGIYVGGIINVTKVQKPDAFVPIHLLNRCEASR